MLKNHSLDLRLVFIRSDPRKLDLWAFISSLSFLSLPLILCWNSLEIFFSISQKIEIHILKMFQFISQELPKWASYFSKFYVFLKRETPQITKTNKKTTVNNIKNETIQTTRKHQPENQVHIVWTLDDIYIALILFIYCSFWFLFMPHFNFLFFFPSHNTFWRIIKIVCCNP